MAGSVVKTGAACDRLKPGDRVWADLANEKPPLGGYATYAVVECSHLGLAPPSLSLIEAATLPLVSMTGRAAFFAAGAPWRRGGGGGGGNAGSGYAGVRKF